MRIKIVFIIILLIPSVSATVVINAQDWQQIGKGINNAQLNNQEFFVVNTPGEAKIADKTIESNITVLQGSNPAVSDLERIIGSTPEIEKISNLTSIKQSDGAIILKKGFGTDMVSALPYAARRNLSIMFWDEETEQKISNTSKTKIFYGDFRFSPESNFADAKHINGSLRERTFKLADRINSTTAVLSPKDQFNPGSLTKQIPVIFEDSLQETAEFLETSSITNLEVIGGSTMFYAKRLDVTSSKDFAIVAKIGRTFRGIQEREGVYQVKNVEIPQRQLNLEIGDLQIAENSTAVKIQLVNRGSVSPNVDLGLKTENKTYSSNVNIPAYTTVGIHENMTKGWSDMNVTVQTDETQLQKSFSRDEAVETRIENLSKLDLSDWRYNETEKTLKLSFENRMEKSGWLMAQTGQRSQIARVQQGSYPNVTLRFVSEEPDSIKVFQGQYRRQLVNYEEFTLERESSVNILTLVGLTSVIGVIAFLVLLIWKGRTLASLFQSISNK